MEIIHSIILAVIQGITEFLPISSSGHLVIIPWLFNFKDPGLSFDIALHLGTTLALIIYFRRDLLHILKGFISFFYKNINATEEDKNLFLMIAIGTIPAVLAGYFGKELIQNTFRIIPSISFFLIVIALFMLYVDKKSKKVDDITSITLRTALIIGCFQSLALIPGVSRSGITIIAGLLFGLNRESSAKFSFLLSTPIVIGAGIYESKHILEITSNPSMTIPLIIGFIVSVITGYLAIEFLLNYLRKHTLSLFVTYRIILGLLLLGIYFLK